MNNKILGAILIILIIVIGLAAFDFFGGIPDTCLEGPPPTASLIASNNTDTVGADVVIKHRGGDMLKGGDYKLSVMPAGESPNYQISVPGSDFFLGDMILVNATTANCHPFGSDSPCTLTNSSLTTGTLDLMAMQKYDIKLVHIPTNTMIIDTVIEVR